MEDLEAGRVRTASVSLFSSGDRRRRLECLRLSRLTSQRIRQTFLRGGRLRVTGSAVHVIAECGTLHRRLTCRTHGQTDESFLVAISCALLGMTRFLGFAVSPLAPPLLTDMSRLTVEPGTRDGGSWLLCGGQCGSSVEKQKVGGAGADLAKGLPRL